MQKERKNHPGVVLHCFCVVLVQLNGMCSLALLLVEEPQCLEGAASGPSQVWVLFKVPPVCPETLSTKEGFSELC